MQKEFFFSFLGSVDECRKSFFCTAELTIFAFVFLNVVTYLEAAYILFKFTKLTLDVALKPRISVFHAMCDFGVAMLCLTLAVQHGKPCLRQPEFMGSAI